MFQQSHTPHPGDVRDELARLREEVEDLRREAALRERFFGMIAHDLRNPLNAIVFTADTLLKQGRLTETQARAMQRLARSSRRMTRMIEDLLDLVKIRQGGGLPVTPRPTDLFAVCCRVVEEMEATHPGRHVAVEHSGDLHGEWDPDRLAQVVSNLVGNALEYSPEGAAVHLALAGGADGVKLTVENEGPPIPAEMLPVIFDPFRRGAHNGHSAPRGLGLGLFISDQIVRAHAGTISVESAPEQGTRFTVTLPRASALAPSAARVVPINGEQTAGEPSPSPCAEGRSILVVEDDADIRDAIRIVLEDEGYGVRTAGNGREALEALTRGLRPCVVLLDLMMPVMNGWQVLEQLKNDASLSSLPIVVVSAARDARDLPDTVRRCLHKPVPLDVLLKVVHDYCGGA
jgi:CheY-like chemotaxis protein